MESSGLIKVAVYANQVDAELAIAQLRASGIEAFLFNDNEGGMLPGLSLSGGFRIMVAEESAKAAAEALGISAS